MPVYKFYVRGHGGEEEHMLPPAADIPIDIITLGQFGCTMSDEVADYYIYKHYNVEQITTQIEEQVVIYWTKDQRDNWYDNQTLDFTKPKLAINPYNTLSLNLALEGDAKIGDCGVCYWNEAGEKLEWIITLSDGQTILLADILERLKKMLSEPDTIIQLYWTACMSAKYWSGDKKKVSFNPNKNPCM